MGYPNPKKGTEYNYDKKPEVTKKSAMSYREEAGEALYDGKGPGIPAPAGKIIKTESENPVIFVVDDTGSMREWPVRILQRSARLYYESVLVSPDIEISVQAVGDAYSDMFPLQVGDFKKEHPFEEEIRKIKSEGNGGAPYRESYELAAAYNLYFCETPNAEKPLLIFCGDEAFYPKIHKDHMGRILGRKVDAHLDSYDIFKQLCSKFEVYLLKVPYQDSDTDKIIMKEWTDAIGPQQILHMDNPQRVVSDAIGLISIKADKYEIFKDRLEATQPKDHVKDVLETLHPLVK